MLELIVSRLVKKIILTRNITEKEALHTTGRQYIVDDIGIVYSCDI